MFTDNRERTRALAVWSAIAAGGGAVGVLLGGVLTDLASWPWIFFNKTGQKRKDVLSLLSGKNPPIYGLA